MLIELAQKGETPIIVVQGDSVHRKFRQRYTHPTFIIQSRRHGMKADHIQRTLHSREGSLFDFRKDCLFCGTEIS